MKNLKVCKNCPKMAFSLIFVFWCIKQKWSKIQFYLLGHIFVIKFVHFPIDISDFSGGEVPSMCTLNEAKNSADPRKSLNLRAYNCKNSVRNGFIGPPTWLGKKYSIKRIKNFKNYLGVFGRFSQGLSHCASVLENGGEEI